MLKILMPARKRYFLNRQGRAIEKSSVRTAGNRPARERGPTKSWNSSTADHGNPDRNSRHGREVPLAGQPDGAAKQQPMPHVGRYQVALIGPDDRIAEVAVEVVVVVQIGRAARPHIRHRQVAALATQIPHRAFEFPVARRASAGKAQDAGRRIGRHHMLVRAVAPQKRHLQEHPAAKPLVPFDVADLCFGRAQAGRRSC